MSTLIIDYGMSNLGSIGNALQECGAKEIKISQDPRELNQATHIILPGVGSFKDGMENLNNLGFKEALRDVVLKDKIPILGICLGMQLLADKGYEGGEIEGLGLISGEVIKLIPQNKKERIPHVGWDEVFPKNEGTIFHNIPNKTDFYFVHSFHFIPKRKGNILATTPYCGAFVSAVANENCFGVQFHPEKSQRPGFQLLTNFLNI